MLGQALSEHGVRLLNAEHETVVVEVNENPENEQAYLCHRRGLKWLMYIRDNGHIKGGF